MLPDMRTRTIQVRRVPKDVRRKLKARAKRQGVSLSADLRRELTLLSEQLAWEELFEEIDREDRTPTGIDWADEVRAGRDERDRETTERVLHDDPRS